MTESDLKEYRCLCGKLLFKGLLSAGTVEIKCKTCRHMLSFMGEEILENPSPYSQFAPVQDL